MSIPFAQISAAALAIAPSLLAEWFPQGRTCGREFKVGNLRGDPGQSLSINLDTGVWADFAEKIFGADFIDLRAAMAHGGNKGAAAKELAQRVGIFVNGAGPHPPKTPPPRQPNKAEWIPMVPPPAGTAAPPESAFAKFDSVFEYTDVSDRRGVTHYVGRIEARNGRRKEFLPLTYGTLGGRQGWHQKRPANPLPLYGLNRLDAFPDTEVILCEGEKSADAAQALFPDRPCLSWYGGTGSVDYADLDPLLLRARRVIIWPDADEAGYRAAAKLAAKLLRARILRVDDLGDGFDAADLITDDPDAWLADRLPKDGPTPETDDPTPETIDGDWWIARELTRPVPVLGEVICASTRALIGGPTGAGKTHLAMAMAGAIATTRGFLHWPGPAMPLVVLYIDGEMARDLIQDRMRDLQRRLGGVSLANLHMLCREDFPAMEGLNTQPGQKFVLAAVERLKPAVIFFDSRMCLLVGDMKDEIPWTQTMPLVWALTRLQVAQIWLDHTGHDGGHIYGSKTKEWQMDLVGLVEEASDPSADIAIKLRWTKARRRRPETQADFSPGIITLRGDEWLWTPDEAGAGDKSAKRGRGMSDETELLRRAINTLASDPSVQTIRVPETSFPVRAVGVVTTIAHLITNSWFIETVDYGEEIKGGTNTLTRRGRDRLRNSLITLKSRGFCGFNRDFIWPAK